MDVAAQTVLFPLLLTSTMGKTMPPEALSTDIDLAAGTQLLRGQYTIDCSLSKGGFGITYLARDSLNRKVVIKECFPQDHCARWGTTVDVIRPEYAKSFEIILERFKREAFRLAALDHPRVVGVHQVFVENGTAFLSMDHIQGHDLFTIVEEHPDRLTASSIHALLLDALEAIEYIHTKGLRHRDLAPDNFILGDDNRLTLIDFGSACEVVTPSEEENTKVLAVKDGYSPHEFYEDAEQDASSDIYSLAATFHYLITGYAPPDSQERLSAVRAGKPDPFEPLSGQACGLNDRFVSLINQGLSLASEDRIPSAKAWLGGLQGDPVIPQASTTSPPEEIDPAKISRLVSDTNSRLVSRDPVKENAATQDEIEAQRKEAGASKPRQFVDIFGNPIEDVEAFLRDQDKARKTRKHTPKPQSEFRSAPRPEPRPQPQSQDIAQEAQPRVEASVLGRMADILGLGKRRLTSVIPQN